MIFVSIIETYSFSFQRNGVMNKASTDIYAVYKGSLPSMEVFSICAWVKFHFEVNETCFKFFLWERSWEKMLQMHTRWNIQGMILDF